MRHNSKLSVKKFGAKLMNVFHAQFKTLRKSLRLCLAEIEINFKVIKLSEYDTELEFLLKYELKHFFIHSHKRYKNSLLK